MTKKGDALIADVATYLELEQEHLVNMAAHFKTMMSRYRVRPFPHNRYEFRQEADQRGILLRPPELEHLARERNRYEEESPEWSIFTDTMNELYHVGGTIEHDVYADEKTVWMDDGETMQQADSIGAAIPIEEMVEAYNMMRDMDAPQDAKEQFEEISDRYAVGFVDPDKDIFLFYDIDNEIGYIFDMYEVELYEVTTELQDLIEYFDYRPETEGLEENVFEQYLEEQEE